ncbi:MAG TPA: hypothetical protein VMW17_17260 [Candidatus Binatia bacterium]|nr:hypothetical protein [Candidatus Binatia bacterium]
MGQQPLVTGESPARGNSVDAAAYARFLAAVGYRVLPTRSSIWYDANRHFYLSAPSHRLFEPADDELRGVLRWPCLGVRFATPLSAPGKLSYQIVCDTSTYGFEILSANSRSKVRRGLKRCRIEPTPFETLATAGLRAHHDTLIRQDRDGGLSGDRWTRFWASAAATPGFEGWGAWSGDGLAAFLVTVTFEESVEFLMARSCSDELGAYPNNALIFSVAEEMLVRRGIPEITFGLESLEPVGPLDQFKFGMGFRARPLRQRVVFHPLVRALLRRAGIRRRFYQWSDRRGATVAFWRKAGGLLRFAEAGGL